IPEDDPRNPAVIADNVGDNVGDCAGMAADLFETYVVTIVATMVLGTIFIKGEMMETLTLYPLLIGAVCIVGSILGTFAVKLGKQQNIMGALYKGLLVCTILSAGFIVLATQKLIGFEQTFMIGDLVVDGTKLLICAFTG